MLNKLEIYIYVSCFSASSKELSLLSADTNCNKMVSVE